MIDDARIDDRDAFFPRRFQQRHGCARGFDHGGGIKRRNWERIGLYEIDHDDRWRAAEAHLAVEYTAIILLEARCVVHGRTPRFKLSIAWRGTRCLAVRWRLRSSHRAALQVQPCIDRDNFRL